MKLWQLFSIVSELGTIDAVSQCEDWFHGECINLSKEIGESLIEKFICPNCSDEALMSVYKKTCGLDKCRKPSRMNQDHKSAFCSDAHKDLWWERMIASMPKNKTRAPTTDITTQEEMMALIAAGMFNMGEDGHFNVAKTPFQDPVPRMNGGKLGFPLPQYYLLKGKTLTRLLLDSSR